MVSASIHLVWIKQSPPSLALETMPSKNSKAVWKPVQKNSPTKKVVVNLSPRDIRKRGAYRDFSALIRGQLPKHRVDDSGVLNGSDTLPLADEKEFIVLCSMNLKEISSVISSRTEGSKTSLFSLNSPIPWSTVMMWYNQA